MPFIGHGINGNFNQDSMKEYKTERQEAFEQLEASWNELKRVIIEETKIGKFLQYLADKIGRWL